MSKILKDKVKQRFILEFSGLFSKEIPKEEKINDAIKHILDETIQRDHINLSDVDKNKIIEEIVNEFIGFGPLESLLKDKSVTEIMINSPKKIYVERQGKKELSNITFDNEQQLMYVIYKILAPTRRHVDEFCPYTDVSLRDGSRVNIVIPPLALDGPAVTIRKFLKNIKTIEDLISLNTLNERMSRFLLACVRAKVNMIFSGSTGAGKTTTLNVFSSYIDNDERIITIEDTAELRLNQDNVVRLETKQPSLEGKGEVTIRELFKNSLRMRPERIILGEIRGVEALDMLQAICSGHTGSLAILHANSPQDVIFRLENMVLTSGLPLSLDAIHRQISAAVHLIIHQEQLLDGSRKVSYISQVNGLKDGRVILEDIFVYEIEDIDLKGNVKGRWHATGIVPVFYNLFKKSGVDLPKEIFNRD